jgi:hypothetical protein
MLLHSGEEVGVDRGRYVKERNEKRLVPGVKMNKHPKVIQRLVISRKVPL